MKEFRLPITDSLRVCKLIANDFESVTKVIRIFKTKKFLPPTHSLSLSSCSHFIELKDIRGDSKEKIPLYERRWGWVSWRKKTLLLQARQANREQFIRNNYILINIS